jgi:methylmalonyl-CoA mutase
VASSRQVADWGSDNIKNWLTPEQIPVKPVYSKDDPQMEHLNYAAGVAPFLRGPYQLCMYATLTIRQHAGFRLLRIECLQA